VTSETLFRQLEKTANRFPGHDAVGFFKDEQLRFWTYRAFVEKVIAASEGLRSLGFKKGDRLGILAPNSPEWNIIDFAALRLGVITIPIHTSLAGSQVREIMRLSHAKGLALGQGGAMESFQALCSLLPTLRSKMAQLVREELPDLRHLILLHDHVEDVGSKRISVPLSELMDLGRTKRGKKADEVRPEDVASILYTSGTTGEMKGVMLTHRNILENALASIPATGALKSDIHLEVLPVSHAFERTCGLFMHLFMGATVVIGRGPAFILQDLQAARPTLTAFVPRILEKICGGLRGKVAKTGKIAATLFEFGVRRTALYRKWQEEKNPLSILVFLQSRWADRLFYQKMREAFGGRLRKIVSGGASLDPQITDFFLSIGILIQEGYGMTEHGPTVTVNPENRPKPGSVGKPLPNVELRIGPDDEVLVRSPCIMKGYEANPEETKRVIDKDGWLHTGDQGTLDEDGYLFLRGRLKEMLVTSYGKNVYPAPLEQALQKSPYIKQAMVIGEKRSYLIALIVPEKEHVEEALREKKIGSFSWRALCELPETKALLSQEVQKCLRPFAHHEQIKDFVVLAEEFSEQNALLTPTMKLRRSKIEKHYQAAVEKIYASHS